MSGRMPGVKRVVAVASGKGGVGKSTVSANLALALAAKGARVGIMDADVYGPSIPTILGVTEKPEGLPENRIAPVEKYGLKIISMGFFVPANEAVIWRGPMLHKMVQDFLSVVDWGELDYLIVDLPPGTGDIQLSLCQSIPLAGAVIVSTPQDVAWNVAQKAIVMFDKLNTPVIGVIENMSHYICAHCGTQEEVFGRGGARRAAEMLGIPFLGDIPLLKQIRSSADEGDPIVRSDPGHAVSRAFLGIADRFRAIAEDPDRLKGSRKVPLKLSAAGADPFRVTWNDGTESVFSSKALREACPCAVCVNEITGERMIRPGSVPDSVRVAAAHPVGRYALQLVWSDGHATGLYGFEYLAKLSA